MWCILLLLRRVWAARKPGCKQENREQGKKQGSTKVSASATATGACVYCNATRSRPFITKGSCVLWTPKSISTWDLRTWATTNVKHEPTSDALCLITHTLTTRKECNWEVSGEYGTICSREGSFRFIPQSCAPKLIEGNQRRLNFLTSPIHDCKKRENAMRSALPKSQKAT